MNFPTLNDEKTGKWLKLGLFCVLTAFCLFGIYFAVNHAKRPSDEPVRMRFSDTEDKNSVKRQLRTSDREASEIVTKIERIHDGTTKPNVSYYVTAPNLNAAADKTEQAIRKNDSQIPSAARAKSDRTVVTVDEEKQKVDVYKINLRNNHKVKAGGTYIDGKPYLSIGYQAGRVEGIIHTDGTGVRGCSLMYTVKEW
nr:MAG TPA: chitin synthase regulator [Caudoviricetes sp.]